MENLVWSKMNQFLRELRCEDASRGSYFETEEYRNAITEKMGKRRRYQEALANFPSVEKECIEAYVEAVEECTNEECQKAYMQGFFDCIMALSGAKIIKPREEIENIINVLK